MVPKVLHRKHLYGRTNVKKEAMEMKKWLDPEEFQNFTASNGWIEKWKKEN